jgi:hypothetical protein
VSRLTFVRLACIGSVRLVTSGRRPRRWHSCRTTWWPNYHGHVFVPAVSHRENLYVHVFPRYADDELYASEPYPEFVTAEQFGPGPQVGYLANR